MTRSQRIQKLANAIKDYRGQTSSPVGAISQQWLHGPQFHRRLDIVRHLVALGRRKDQIEQDAKAIDGFKSHTEFHAWLKETFEKKG